MGRRSPSLEPVWILYYASMYFQHLSTGMASTCRAWITVFKFNRKGGERA